MHYNSLYIVPHFSGFVYSFGNYFLKMYFILDFVRAI